MQSLRLAVTGAAPVPVELIERMEQELGFETVVTGYGLTECVRHRHDVPPRRPAETHLHHARGGPSPASRCASWTTTAHEVPARRARRGRRAGLQRDAGLLRGPRADRRGRSTPTAGCTPATSARWTSDGYLAITDRKKDMFITGGFNAYPAEIERLLLTHPDIAQVAVIGVPDERMGEVGMAFVVPTAGATAPTRRGRGLGPRAHGELQGAPRTSASSRRCR